MLTIRSLVLGALFSVWQYVKCQDQNFPINSPFVPMSTFSRSSRSSHAILPQEMNQPNLYDQMNYENMDIRQPNQDTDPTTKINMNVNQNLNRPITWHQSKSMSRIGQRRFRNRKPRRFRTRHSTPNIDSLLRYIDPELSALDLDLGSSLQQFGRRSATSHSLDDNENLCHSSVDTLLLKINIIKESIQDLENYVTECTDTSQKFAF